MPSLRRSDYNGGHYQYEVRVGDWQWKSFNEWSILCGHNSFNDHPGSILLTEDYVRGFIPDQTKFNAFIEGDEDGFFAE